MNSAPTIRTAEILCVGTELLMGQVINSNANFLASELVSLGISSYRQIVIGDNLQRLREQIVTSASRADLVVLTGGLGPTSDDITMEAAAEAAGKKLELHNESYDNIKHHYQRICRNMPQSNKKQAMLPSDATALFNKNGTAPGAMFLCNAPSLDDPEHMAYLILLPGPPSEMRPMFMDQVRPFLEKHNSARFRTEFIRLYGIGESAAEERVKDLIDSQTNPTIAPYASEGECLFRITQRIESEDEEDRIRPLVEIFKDRFGDYIYEVGQRSLKEVVFDLLFEKGMTLSFAESCTAGMASSEFVDVPGSSKVLMGSIVAYDNRIKEQLLGVTKEVLVDMGSVSRECAEQMAVGCRDLLKTDMAVSITGIAGPTAYGTNKPVGLVYLALADKDGTDVSEINLSGNRMRVRRVSVLHAFNMIRKRLQ
ncbi:MAG: competence/damage-inducible protein A [Oscillospiraceae bacterium]|nr:competence/damage-inducible protein A [Oscillospiraceae bacterium]